MQRDIRADLHVIFSRALAAQPSSKYAMVSVTCSAFKAQAARNFADYVRR